MLKVGGGQLVEFDAEFKFAKIQNSHVEGGCGLMEFDAEFRFAKIQNSHVEGGFVEFDAEFKFSKIQNSHIEGGWGGSWNLMLSPNLLKKNVFGKKFSKFLDKKHNGFVLDLEYQVVPLYEV